MNNIVETLRAICFTEEDFKTIKNLNKDSFTDKDLEFVIEFKKIFELGVDQLKIFIDKLDEEGKDLDVYTILYYVNILLNGPLRIQTLELSKDKKYFTEIPDCMGVLGNVTNSNSNITIYREMGYSLGCSVDTYNKLPSFSQTIIGNSSKITEEVFRSGIYSSSFIDNTYPIIDKSNNIRYDEEKKGEWVKKSHGTYMVKDIYFYLETKKASEKIFEKIEEFLGEEHFRILEAKKLYNPFDPEKNISTSKNSIFEKEFIENEGLPNEKKQIIKIDILGDEFDSEEKREYVMKINGEEKEEEYILNSIQGQLGD